MTKHRLTTLVLVAVGVAALSGCGKSSSPSTGNPGATTPPAATPATTAASSRGGGGY